MFKKTTLAFLMIIALATQYPSLLNLDSVKALELLLPERSRQREIKRRRLISFGQRDM